MALPKGDVAETYSYVTDTVGIIQDACGPRCTEAWAKPDGAQLVFTFKRRSSRFKFMEC